MPYTSIYDFIMETAKTDPVEGAFMLASGLMRGERASLKMGYSLGSAIMATVEQIQLTQNQLIHLVIRLADAKPELVEYGPDKR